MEKVPATPENPKGGEQEVTIPKNTNERAIVRILVPKVHQTQSEIDGANNRNVDAEDDAAIEGGDYQEGQPKANSSLEKEHVTNPASRRSNLTNKSTRTIDQDQEEKAVAVAAKVNLPGGSPYIVYQMNQYAAKVHRQDFIDQVRSRCIDYFSENRLVYKQMQELAEEEADEVDQAYLAATCDEYDFPCLEFTVHAPDFE